MEIIRDAIQRRQLIVFALHGLERMAEPHLLGRHGGSIQLLVFQVGGATRSGQLPHWRRVKISEISALRVLDDTFEGPRTFSYPDWEAVLHVVR